MRLRNIKGSRERIASDKYSVLNPELNKGSWSSLFNNTNPIYIEVGMGKGQFITTLAKLNPDINYIGIEKYSSVMLRALQKVENEDIPNLLFIRMEAENLLEVFDKDEISRIYLNFSDPWPKDRHAKRRLTSTQFFERYDSILAADGQVEFKTDNRSLFDFSLEQIPLANWTIQMFTYDLHNSEYNEGNIMTEYEEKFSSLGNPINKLIATR